MKMNEPIKPHHVSYTADEEKEHHKAALADAHGLLKKLQFESDVHEPYCSCVRQTAAIHHLALLVLNESEDPVTAISGMDHVLQKLYETFQWAFEKRLSAEIEARRKGNQPK